MTRQRPRGLTLAEAFAWYPKAAAKPLAKTLGMCVTWEANDAARTARAAVFSHDDAVQL